MRRLFLIVLTVAGLWFTTAGVLSVLDASRTTTGGVPAQATTGLLGAAMLGAALVLFRQRPRPNTARRTTATKPREHPPRRPSPGVVASLEAAPSRPDPTIAALRARLRDGMIRFLHADEDGEDDEDDETERDPPPYTEADVDACLAIVDTYLQTVDSTPTERVLPLLRSTVERLNERNTSCHGALIETEQREDLCAILSMAARNAGVQVEGDLTEPWREW